MNYTTYPERTVGWVEHPETHRNVRERRVSLRSTHPTVLRDAWRGPMIGRNQKLIPLRHALALGLFDSGGPDRHAEAQALRGLRRHAPAKLDHGKLVVVVDTPVCPSCTAKLVSYAKDVGLAAVDIYLPERQRMTSQNMATAKTFSRTAAMAGRPTLHLRFQGLAVD